MGVLNSRQGLPLVQHKNAVYGRYSREYSDRSPFNALAGDRVYVQPNALQAFLRSALSYHMGYHMGGGSSAPSTATCRTSADCSQTCHILQYDNPKMECAKVNYLALINRS